MKSRVFISHSHLDRQSATDLQAVLQQRGAETYLDQDRIQAADVLPDRIREGITWCNYFLLIWSASAASSAWVRRELEMAYKSGKTIVPYVLDDKPLQSPLSELVYIKGIHDQEHGYSQLLLKIIGEAPLLGHWRASVDVYGMVQATYDLELRANGQVEGEGGMSQSGVLGSLAGTMGMGGLSTMRIPFNGSWSYDWKAKVLILETSVDIMGHMQNETIRIRTTGLEKGAISGKDLGGRLWTFHRQTDSVRESSVRDQKLTVEGPYQKGIALWNGTNYSNPQLAIDYFKQAIHLDPQSPTPYHARGIAYKQLGLLKEALADSNRSISLLSDNPAGYTLRGSTYYAMNDMVNAKKDWEKACEMGDTNACQNLRDFFTILDVSKAALSDEYTISKPKIEGRMSGGTKEMLKSMEEIESIGMAVLSVYIAGAFPREVALFGKDYKTYKTEKLTYFNGAEFLASPLPVFTNEQGHKFRTVRTQSRHPGKAWARDPNVTFIWYEGNWKQIIWDEKTGEFLVSK